MGLCALSSEVGNAALKQTVLSLFAKCNRGATVTEIKNFWVLWSFLISSVIENLNPVSLQKTADLFPEHVPQESFRLIFQCRNLYFSIQKTLYCCCYEFNVVCGESPRHTWVYCVPCGVCNQRNLAKRKGQAKKNTSAIYLFISFWQNALAKYALELGHHTICEQTRCCVQ